MAEYSEPGEAGPEPEQRRDDEVGDADRSAAIQVPFLQELWSVDIPRDDVENLSVDRNVDDDLNVRPQRQMLGEDHFCLVPLFKLFVNLFFRAWPRFKNSTHSFAFPVYFLPSTLRRFYFSIHHDISAESRISIWKVVFEIARTRLVLSPTILNLKEE